jgi:acyl-CoA thioesterase-2
MTASFQRDESGLEHQAGMPAVPPPEELRDIAEIQLENVDKLPARLKRFLQNPRPFLVRPAREDYLDADYLQPIKHVWMKAIGAVPDDSILHQALLAYISDYQLLGTATLPHGDASWLRGNLQMASLDHAMWFHRRCRVDEWLLFSYDSPAASGARGLARGQVFTRDGVLVASTVQEGLIRVRD